MIKLSKADGKINAVTRGWYDKRTEKLEFPEAKDFEIRKEKRPQCHKTTTAKGESGIMRYGMPRKGKVTEMMIRGKPHKATRPATKSST